MSKHYLHGFVPGKKGGVAHTVGGEVLDLAVYGVASYGLGYLTGKYREKSLLFGGRVPLDFAAGLAFTALGGYMGWSGHGEAFAGLVGDVGKAGIGAWAHTHGVGDGTKASGVKRLLVQEKDLAKARAALPDAVVLGGIPPAKHGAFLSPERLQDLAK